uniref:3-oxoacyl-ACP synthase n=1 Tax=Roseihalotalea indica TaxID=2867963 RepID=A0AA49JH08_9BACT|nr:3-oxoacyl-ACP synthase [Tunicatimonas sp. TK19036]
MDLTLKKQVFAACQTRLTERIADLREEMKETQLAASEETKSSAGDKYETGRAMLDMESERLSGQLNEARKLYDALMLLSPTKSHDKVQIGSLVATSRGTFYVSVGLGAVKVDDVAYYCISPQSPMGQVLAGLSAGEEAPFQGQTVQVMEVV